jgi:hypothetical protein
MASLTAPIAVPPKVPGKVRLVQLLQDKATEAMTFDVIVHHMGKNTEGYKVVKVPPEYLPLGWRINTEKVRTKKIVTVRPGIPDLAMASRRKALHPKASHIRSGLEADKRDSINTAAIKIVIYVCHLFETS